MTDTCAFATAAPAAAQAGMAAASTHKRKFDRGGEASQWQRLQVRLGWRVGCFLLVSVLTSLEWVLRVARFS